MFSFIDPDKTIVNEFWELLSLERDKNTILEIDNEEPLFGRPLHSILYLLIMIAERYEITWSDKVIIKRPLGQTL